MRCPGCGARIDAATAPPDDRRCLACRSGATSWYAGKDHYQVLGIDRTASDEAVRQAWRAGVKASHPDHHAGAAHAARFHAVQQAFEVLGHPQRRAEYDGSLAVAEAAPSRDGATSADEPSTPPGGVDVVPAPRPVPGSWSIRSSAERLRAVWPEQPRVVAEDSDSWWLRATGVVLVLVGLWWAWSELVRSDEPTRALRVVPAAAPAPAAGSSPPDGGGPPAPGAEPVMPTSGGADADVVWQIGSCVRVDGDEAVLTTCRGADELRVVRWSPTQEGCRSELWADADDGFWCIEQL